MLRQTSHTASSTTPDGNKTKLRRDDWVSRSILAGARIALAPPAVAHQASVEVTSQQQTKRLILKDGSYQSVVKYEIQGDRVRHLSAERYQWEDVPSALVNWGATKKNDAEFSNGKTWVYIETAEKRRSARKRKPIPQKILRGPHFLGTGGVFLLDQYNGKPELAEILQNGSELNQLHKQQQLANGTIL